MIENFTAEAWDAWKDLLIRMLICSELGPLDPCWDDFLDEALRSLFFSHRFLVQYDAGELVGWLRGAHRSMARAPIHLIYEPTRDLFAR